MTINEKRKKNHGSWENVSEHFPLHQWNGGGIDGQVSPRTGASERIVLVHCVDTHVAVAVGVGMHVLVCFVGFGSWWGKYHALRKQRAFLDLVLIIRGLHYSTHRVDWCSCSRFRSRNAPSQSYVCSIYIHIVCVCVSRPCIFFLFLYFVSLFSYSLCYYDTTSCT